MNHIHTIIKIHYVNEGYLPNYPHHMISDEEMFKAFLNREDPSNSFFYNYYPIPTQALQQEYDALVDCLSKVISDYLADGKAIPNWAYAYMLGKVISDMSSIADKHDFLVLLDKDNIEDKFDESAAFACYKLSSLLLSRMAPDKRGHRVPSMFGESNILKHLRLMDLEVS